MIDYDRMNSLRKQKQYLKVAKSALNRYLREVTYISYVNPQNKPFYYIVGEENQLLLANGLSVYLFETQELLSKKQVSKLNEIYKNKALLALNELEKYEQKQLYPVLEKDFDELGRTVLSSNNEDQLFNARSFGYAAHLLGQDTKFYLCRRSQACIAQSEKGKGLILGVNNRFL